MIGRDALEECRRFHANARGGGGGGWGWLGRPKLKLNHGQYQQSLGKVHDRLFQDGQVIWAVLVMANPALYHPGTLDLPGAIVYSFDPLFEESDPLKKVAMRVANLKDTVPRDLALLVFAAEVSNEAARETNVLVPESLTGGREVRYESLFIQRHRLPTDRLVDAVIPVISNPSRATQVMLLPLEFWSQQLVAHWRRKALHTAPPAEPQVAPADADQYAADPITLTDAALREVRAIIKQQRLTDAKLRVAVQHGAYQLDLVEDPVDAEADLVNQFAGLSIVIDRISAAQMMGLVIDCQDSPAGRGFRFIPRQRR